MIAVAVLTVAAAIILNWDWLVAAGVALPILALLPCTIMCAVGLCMNKRMGITWFARSRAEDKTAAEQIDNPPAPAANPEVGSGIRHDE
ncbi:MAG: hypothetical protein ABIS45_01800 [Burkholderiales bacterium]